MATNPTNPIKTLSIAGSTYNIHAFEADHADKATKDDSGKDNLYLHRQCRSRRKR